MKYFVNNGCNLNHLDTYGQTPIFYAAREGHLSTVELLVSLGSDPDVVDNNGQTPTFYTIKGNKVDIADFLLKNGCKIDI